jgi:two-component system, LytTR family, sensor kinase
MQKLSFLQGGKQLAIIFAVWTALAFIPGIQAHTYIASLGHAITWRRALMPALINHWIWAGLTPGVLWISARYPLERRAWARVVGIHLLGGIGFAVLHVAIRLPLFSTTTLYTPQPIPVSWTLFRNSMLANFYDDLWMYSSLVAFSQFWNYYRKYKDRELRATKLEAQLAQAQLQVLKMQLNPHFLFNTLHAISSLMQVDVEAADDMVTRLSDLLRMSLESMNQHEISLKREMEFLQSYLEIQRVRFRDRLTVRIDTPAGVLDALVPNMILQPLVENAVTYGIAARSTAGEIQVRALQADGMLRLEVVDDGMDIQAHSSETHHGGLGLANTKARLRQLYGEAQRLTMEARAGGGTIVTLEIPFRLCGASKLLEDKG